MGKAYEQNTLPENKNIVYARMRKTSAKCTRMEKKGKTSANEWVVPSKVSRQELERTRHKPFLVSRRAKWKKEREQSADSATHTHVYTYIYSIMLRKNEKEGKREWKRQDEEEGVESGNIFHVDFSS